MKKTSFLFVCCLFIVNNTSAMESTELKNDSSENVDERQQVKDLIKGATVKGKSHKITKVKEESRIALHDLKAAQEGSGNTNNTDVTHLLSPLMSAAQLTPKAKNLFDSTEGQRLMQEVNSTLESN